MTFRWPIYFLLLFLISSYWAISLEHLDRFPPVHEDEPWIAAAPYKLANEGIYASDLFAGYYGLERRNYQHMPIFPLLQALVFKVAGAGVPQMRFLPVLFGFLTLWAVFAVGRQIGGDRLGIIAVVLLLSLRLAGGTTGIPLLDLTRISRYDIAVPFFGLMAFWAFNRAERSAARWWYTVTGVLIGLAGLSHLYGTFWLPAVLAVLLYRRGWSLFHRADPWLIAAGFGVVWLPWIGYIATGWADYTGQMRLMAGRFDLFDPHFYVRNLLGEIDRYRSLDLFDDSGRLRLMRPGTWAVLVGMPAAIGLGLKRLRRCPNDPALALLILLIVQSLLFALLLASKNYHYAINLIPSGLLLLAWVGLQLWESWKKSSLLRGLLVGLLVLIVIEGGISIFGRRADMRRTTSYAQFSQRIASHISEGSLVLGLHHYWLGLRQFPYRSWLLPVLLSNPLYYHESLSLDEALDRIKPDVILIDRHMRSYFDSLADPAHPRHPDYLAFRDFMQRHEATLAGVVEDPTYGTVQVYRLRASAPGEDDP